jgi:hypothetical protein
MTGVRRCGTLLAGPFVALPPLAEGLIVGLTARGSTGRADDCAQRPAAFPISVGVSGTSPSCWKKPSASVTTQSSTMRPPATR